MMPYTRMLAVFSIVVGLREPAYAQFAQMPQGRSQWQPQQCDFAETVRAFENLLQTQQLPGGGLWLADRQGVYLERYFGSYDADTVLAIASATKLLSATRLLQLQSRGQVDFDAPVASYLPQFSGEKGTMTLNQMFSHTAGYGDDSFAAILLNPNLTLAQAVDQIACCRPLNTGYSVGGQFSYGGVSMHIAGRVAEVRGGGDWQARWRSELGQPLGAQSIDWELSGSSNYGIAGTARASMPDYAKVLRLLAKSGRVDGRRLLSTSSVKELERNRVGNLPVAYAPPNAPAPIRYGLGSWHDSARAPGERPLIHSLGAFGFFPWLDFSNGRYGVFMIRGSGAINSVAGPTYFTMLQQISNTLDQGCAHLRKDPEIFGDDLES